MPPLAERMRPRSLEDYVGQEHLVGEKAVLRQAIESGKLPSLIFWGPPGVGKTTLAQIIAQTLDRPFHILSAINSGVKDIREVIDKAKRQRFFDRPNPILFIDEVHRFSKSQQDSLLGAVEKGMVTLVGATTENPSFEVIPALLSRCQVYVLKPLDRKQLQLLLDKAIREDEYLRDLHIELKETEALMQYSGGDARKLYNVLELVTNYGQNGQTIVITNQRVKEIIQENILLYDKTGEQHYDLASAFIKSMRASDPNASVYYLARMLEGGEQIEFIARRMIILAAEDIGLANPNALLMASTCMDAIRTVGMPEARIILSQAVIYLATSPKSNAAYEAINRAQAVVRDKGNLPIPLHLRNAPTKLMKDLGYGTAYQYAHQFEGNFADMECLPEELSGTTFYQPGDNPQEESLRNRLRSWWKAKYGY